MGRYGYGYGYAPCRTPAVIWSADFSALPLSTTANASELRAAIAAMGLTLTRASSATVQTSASEVVTSGIGVDDPRVGRYGLVIEEARENKNARSDPSGAGWFDSGNIAAAPVTSTIAGGGPDGGAAAEIVSPAVTAGWSIRAASSVTLTAASWTLSAFLKGSVGGEATYLNATPNGVSYLRGLATLTNAWGRYSATGTATAAAWFPAIGTDKRDASQANTAAQTVRAALVQLELGKFPTEAILTTGAAATRAADNLSLSDLSRIVRSGQIRVELDFIAKGARSDYTSFVTLFSYDSNNYVAFQASTGRILTGTGGVTYTSSAGGPFATWSAGDRVRAFAALGNGTPEVWVKVGDAAAVNLSGGSAAGAFPSSGALGIFRTNATQYMSAWLQRIRAYAPGRRPAWAA